MLYLESCSLPHGVTSQDVPERLIPKDDNNRARLPHTLKLAVRALVMLRRNIMCDEWCPWGDCRIQVVRWS